MDYSPEERTAAIIIASLIYADYPGGPDLETDSSALGLLASAVESCRDPYHMAAITMPIDGVLRDCTGDAATAWEGLRQMSSAMRPYAQLDPLIREIGGGLEIQELLFKAMQPVEDKTVLIANRRVQVSVRQAAGYGFYLAESEDEMMAVRSEKLSDPSEGTAVWVRLTDAVNPQTSFGDIHGFADSAGR